METQLKKKITKEQVAEQASKKDLESVILPKVSNANPQECAHDNNSYNELPEGQYQYNYEAEDNGGVEARGNDNSVGFFNFFRQYLQTGERMPLSEMQRQASYAYSQLSDFAKESYRTVEAPIETEDCDQAPAEDAEQQANYYGNYYNYDPQTGYYYNYNSDQQQQQQQQQEQNAAYYGNYYNGYYGYYNGNEQNGYYNTDNNAEAQQNNAYYNNTEGQQAGASFTDNAETQQNYYYTTDNAEGQQMASYANYNQGLQDGNYTNYADGEQQPNYGYYPKNRNKKKARRAGHKGKAQNNAADYQVSFHNRSNEPYHPYDYYLPANEASNDTGMQKAGRYQKRHRGPPGGHKKHAPADANEYTSPGSVKIGEMQFTKERHRRAKERNFKMPERPYTKAFENFYKEYCMLHGQGGVGNKGLLAKAKQSFRMLNREQRRKFNPKMESKADWMVPNSRRVTRY